ncbi:hypothetical protein SEA_DIZZYRUDY_47 [Microbacterium phage DizzyRudy]|nr:hypothetical protein SEA_DIZZYRUDY_47 [Microbacterium phage DizzyRudy]WMI34482.1 hypothetical protein SEA_DAMASCUS_45 [Microbacterium phage Damascus]
MSSSSKKFPIKLILWKLLHIHGIGRFAVGRRGLIYCTSCHTTYRTN